MDKTHVTNTSIKEYSIYAVLQFSNSYQRDNQKYINNITKPTNVGICWFLFVLKNNKTVESITYKL